MVRFNNQGLVNLLILVGLGAAVIVLAVLAVGNISNKTPVQLINPPKAPTYSPSPTSQQLKTFQSKFMKFSVKVPDKFEVKANEISVNLVSNEGEINIISNGTQFTNLRDYINDFDFKRHNPEIKFEKYQSISNFPATERILVLKSTKINEKLYYIFVEPTVYIISTSSESLYSTLNQIAQSFRYIP